MKVTVYSTHKFEVDFLNTLNGGKHELNYLHVPLGLPTAYLAKGSLAVSIFVNDDASAPTLDELARAGVKFLVLRSAGFNNVDLEHAKQLGVRVARVSAYSPNAVAEHAIALMLALNRKLIRANSRVHELNFSLDGLTGFDMNGKTAGIIGTGNIGSVVVKILHAFGCRILAWDPVPDEGLVSRYNVSYVDAHTVFKQSDIISLHAPLTKETRYVVRQETIELMKDGVMIINTSRGGLLNTKDVINSLKTGKIGYLGLDVYEEESKLFFEDHSQDILQDDAISRLLTFRNVLITSHQGFLTDTALKNIADTTISNLDCFAKNGPCANELL